MTASGVTVNGKTYDSTTSATFTGTYSLPGVYSGDTVTLDESGATATFASKDVVATGSTVSITGLALAGDQAGDYSLTDPTATTTATITPFGLTASGVTVNGKTYDSTTSATFTGTYSLPGVYSGDTVTLDESGATATFASKDVVATGSTVSITGLALAGDQAGDYSLTDPTATATATITPALLTVTGVTVNGKTYDATTSATFTGSYSLPGVYSGDTVSLNENGATATFASKDVVATGSTVSITGLALAGDQAGDYSLTDPTATATATITPALLTVTGVTVNGKTYDATTSATFTGSYSLPGVYSGDTVSLNENGATATFASKDVVATGSTVSITGLALAGDQAGDYSLTDPTATATATITPALLTVTGVTVNGKTYDATTSATFTGSYSLPGVYSGDTVSLNENGATATFASKDVVATGSTVSITGLALAGGQAGDYSLTDPSTTTTATITPFALTASGVTVNGKTYDSTTSATFTGTYSLPGVYSGDTVTLDESGATATFASKDVVATGSTVSITGLALAGGQAGDYSLTDPTGTTTATITPFALTAENLLVNERTYDQTTSAALTPGAYDFGSGVYSGDTVTLDESGATATFDTADAGQGKNVTITGLAIGGSSSNDYTLTDPSTTTYGIIDQLGLTVTEVTVNGKTYDSTTSATFTGSYSLPGVFSGDTVTLDETTATASFASKHVGTGISVSIAGLALTGAQSQDYSLVDPTPTTTANITPAPLTVFDIGVSSKTYDRTTTASLTGSYDTNFGGGLYSGDTVTLDESGATATFDSKDVKPNQTVTVTGLALGGSSVNDYSLTSTSATTTAAITPELLTATSVAVNGKTYDSTTSATFTGSYSFVGTVFSGDTVSLDESNATATFASKDVMATGSTVSITGLALAGDPAGDYSLVDPTTTSSATITPFALTASGVTVNGKTYDSTTSATFTGTYSLPGVFSGDTVTVDESGATATFASKDVATGITVSITGLALAGGQASDYSLTDPTGTTTATITPFALTVSNVAVNSKTYDTTSRATFTGSYTLPSIFSGDTVTLDESTATATFNNKHVGTAKTVTFSGLGLTGAQAFDYSLTDPSGTTTAAVTPQALTATSVTANNKVYDGTTSATLTGSYSFTGLYTGDAVSLSETGATATFDTIHVATGKTVSITGLALSGMSAWITA